MGTTPFLAKITRQGEVQNREKVSLGESQTESYKIQATYKLRIYLLTSYVHTRKYLIFLTYVEYRLLRVLVLFRRVTSSSTIPTYNPTGPLRPIYFGFRRETMASSGVGHIMGCGGLMPSTQQIAVTLTPGATRRCAGSRAYDHHSRRKLTLMVPHFS